MSLHTLLVLGVGLLLTADQPRPDPVTQEMAKFQGGWKMVAMEVEGKAKAVQPDTKLVVHGDQFAVYIGGKIAAQVTMTVDPTKKPKAIDLIAHGKKRLIRGIYSLEGGTLTLCDRGAEKGVRPTQFATTADSGLVLVIFRRPQAPDAKDDAVRKELRQFQGSWKAVALHHGNGGQASVEEVEKTRLVVEGNKFTLAGKGLTISGTFTVNPSTTPKTIDVRLTSKDGREVRLLGIYQIHGDRRQSCFAPPGKERPTRFSAGPGYLGFDWKRN